MTQLNIAQNLTAGDIAFIGFHQDTPDGFTFITLTDIPANEVIYFTDHSWSAAFNNWHNNTIDAHYAWTAPSTGASIGTIVTITETNTENILTTTVGTISMATNFGNFSLIPGGDVLFAYQSTTGAKPTADNATFLAGIYTDDNYAHNTDCDGPQGWYNGTPCASDYTAPGTISTGGNASGIAPGLTNGVNAVHLYPPTVLENGSENDNGRYTGTLTGNADDIRALINDRTKWSFEDTPGYDISATYFNSNTTIAITPVLNCEAPIISYLTLNLYESSIIDCLFLSGVYMENGIVNDKKSYIQISSLIEQNFGIITFDGTQWILTVPPQEEEGETFIIATNSNVTTSTTAPLTGWVTSEGVCVGSSVEIITGAYFFSEMPYSILAETGYNYYTTETGGTAIDINNENTIEAGTYYVSQTIEECESPITEVTFSLLTINNEITESNGILTATESNATYRWSNCDEEITLNNANSQSYTPTEAGEYKVTIYKSGGAIQSECYEINTLSTISINETPSVTIYPNPANTHVSITSAKATQFVVLNLLGQTVLTFDTEVNVTKSININTLSNGIYLIKSLDTSTIFTHKLIVKK